RRIESSPASMRAGSPPSPISSTRRPPTQGARSPSPPHATPSSLPAPNDSGRSGAIPEHSRSSMPTHRSLLPPAEQRIVMMSHRLLFLSIAGLSVLAACGAPNTDGSSERAVASTVERVPGEVVTVVDTVIEATLDAAGVAELLAQSTLSTKLMGTV